MGDGYIFGWTQPHLAFIYSYDSSGTRYRHFYSLGSYPIVRMSTLRLPAGWLDKELIFSFEAISEGCFDSLSHWSADKALKRPQYN